MTTPRSPTSPSRDRPSCPPSPPAFGWILPFGGTHLSRPSLDSPSSAASGCPIRSGVGRSLDLLRPSEVVAPVESEREGRKSTKSRFQQALRILIPLSSRRQSYTLDSPALGPDRPSPVVQLEIPRRRSINLFRSSILDRDRGRSPSTSSDPSLPSYTEAIAAFSIPSPFAGSIFPSRAPSVSPSPSSSLSFATGGRTTRQEQKERLRELQGKFQREGRLSMEEGWEVRDLTLKVRGI